jgi:DNA-binding response OmpR family regulator
MVNPSLDPVTYIGTADDDVAKRLKRKGFPNAVVRRNARSLAEAVAARASEFERPAEGGGAVLPAVVLLDLELPNASGWEIVRKLNERKAEVSIVMLATSARIEEAAGAVRAGFADDYVLKPFNVNDIVARVRTALAKRSPAPARELDPPLGHVVADLHNDRGRLDAKQFAKLFDIEIGDLLPALGKKGSTVYKTPDSEALQPVLRVLASTASGLVRLVGSTRHARIWMNAPNPALDGHAPIELLKQGNIEALADFVQDLLEGRPA